VQAICERGLKRAAGKRVSRGCGSADRDIEVAERKQERRQVAGGVEQHRGSAGGAWTTTARMVDRGSRLRAKESGRRLAVRCEGCASTGYGS